MVQTILLTKQNRDAGVENKHMDTKGGKRELMDWEIGVDICTLLTLYIK